MTNNDQKHYNESDSDSEDVCEECGVVPGVDSLSYGALSMWLCRECYDASLAESSDGSDSEEEFHCDKCDHKCEEEDICESCEDHICTDCQGNGCLAQCYVCWEANNQRNPETNETDYEYYYNPSNTTVKAQFFRDLRDKKVDGYYEVQFIDDDSCEKFLTYDDALVAYNKNTRGSKHIILLQYKDGQEGTTLKEQETRTYYKHPRK